MDGLAIVTAGELEQHTQRHRHTTHDTHTPKFGVGSNNCAGREKRTEAISGTPTNLLRMERKVLSLEDSSLFILSRPLGPREGDSAPTSVMVDVKGKGRKTTSQIGTKEKIRRREEENKRRLGGEKRKEKKGKRRWYRG